MLLPSGIIREETTRSTKRTRFCAFCASCGLFLSSRFDPNPVAIQRDLTLRTKGTDRLAQILSVGDKQIVIDDPVPARQFLPQRHFGIVGGFRSDIAQPVRNPMHVRIDGNSMLPESKRNNDV